MGKRVIMLSDALGRCALLLTPRGIKNDVQEGVGGLEPRQTLRGEPEKQIPQDVGILGCWDLSREPINLLQNPCPTAILIWRHSLFGAYFLFGAYLV